MLSVCTCFFLSACSENITGPETQSLAQSLAMPSQASLSEKVADLSVRIEATHFTSIDSVAPIALVVYNAGPDAATGIQLRFKSTTSCTTQRVNSTGNGDDGGDITDVLFDIVDGVQSGSRASINLDCLLQGKEPIENTLEVMASDASDPDSKPGNGDPDEDDQTTVRLYPEVPPCPDCPFTIGDF